MKRCIRAENSTQLFCDTFYRISFIFFQIIDDHYHFEHKTLVKRSIDPSHHHQRRLNEDDRIAWSSQQRAKSRQKRDYTRLKPVKTATALMNDPKWSQMWYLVRITFIRIAKHPLCCANCINWRPGPDVENMLFNSNV